jgi:hypothetical protein
VDEEELVHSPKLGGEVADAVEDALRRDARACEPLASFPAGESAQAAARSCDQLFDACVVRSEELGLVVAAERRLQRDARDVDAVPVEQGETTFQAMGVQVDVVGAVDQLEP